MRIYYYVKEKDVSVCVYACARESVGEKYVKIKPKGWRSIQVGVFANGFETHSVNQELWEVCRQLVHNLPGRLVKRSCLVTWHYVIAVIIARCMCAHKRARVYIKHCLCADLSVSSQSGKINTGNKRHRSKSTGNNSLHETHARRQREMQWESVFPMQTCTRKKMKLASLMLKSH